MPETQDKVQPDDEEALLRAYRERIEAAVTHLAEGRAVDAEDVTTILRELLWRINWTPLDGPPTEQGWYGINTGIRYLRQIYTGEYGYNDSATRFHAVTHQTVWGVNGGPIPMDFRKRTKTNGTKVPADN